MADIVLNTRLSINVFGILPAILLTGLAMSLGLLDLFLPASRRRDIGIIAALGLFAIAGVTTILQPPTGAGALILGGMLRFDTMGQIFIVVTLLAAAFACLISLDAPQIGHMGEFYAILCVATLGGVLLSAAADLIMVFLAVETLSISLYILSGFLTQSARSSEAGIKYFLFGAFTSTLMLYGFSLLYGFSGGQTNLYAIGARMQQLFSGPNAHDANLILPVILSMIMVMVGFGFKISAVPFHFWTPDVYEGAPTPVTAFISVASKAASFAMLTRFFLIVFQGDDPTRFWVQMFAVIAIVTMTVGNLMALVQRNIKRLIAYSSIAQAGYALIGVASVASQPTAQVGLGVAAVAFYMAMYIFTNLAAFGVIILFTNATGSEQVSDMAGLSRRNLGLALAMTVALLSLAGVPPAAGFFGKFFLFRAAVDANLTFLAVVGILNAMIALYYYLVIIKVIFVDQGQDEEKPVAVSSPYIWALGLTTLMVILLGTVLATPVLEWATRAGQGLLS